MKIIHELNQLDYGGVERVIRSIIKHDQKNEHTIVAYKDGPFRARLEEVGAKIVVVAENEESDLDADLIHIHSGGGMSQMAADVAGQLPVIETIHSPVRSPIPSNLITRRVGVCDAVARMNSNAIAIRNGVEADELMPENMIGREEFKRECLGIPEGAIVIGRAGRLGYDKGLEEWLLTVYHLQQRRHNIYPVIVGSEARDADGYMGKLKLMAESLPVKNIRWVGHQDNIMDWLVGMDIFLYPSRTEGFGLVFAEAMLAGCAVVAHKTDVTTELFGGHAVLVPLGLGIMGLVNAVECVLKSPELMSELNNSHEFIASEYQAERMSQQYQELYDECRNANSSSQCESRQTDVVLA